MRLRRKAGGGGGSLLVKGSSTEGFMRMREEGGVFRYIEVFVSRKSVMERLKKSGGREEEDLKDLRRREERRGGRGRSKSRSRGRREAPRGGGRRSRSMERGRAHGGGRDRNLSRQEEEWFGGSREKASGYCVKLRGLPWETRKVGDCRTEKPVLI